MSTITELLHANLHEVFGNRDATTRRAAIERTFAPDVVFTDPEDTVTGWDALEAKAAGLLAGVPDSFVFAEAGPAYLGADSGALGWTFGPADAPVARGLDLLTVRDGVVVELRTLLAPQQ